VWSWRAGNTSFCIALPSAAFLVPIWGRTWISVCYTRYYATACALIRIFPMR
jgi:hypothetical protein